MSLLFSCSSQKFNYIIACMSRKVFGCKHLLCVWHIKWDWLNNIYKVSSKEDRRKMFSRLDGIISKCKDDISMKAVVYKF